MLSPQALCWSTAISFCLLFQLTPQISQAQEIVSEQVGAFRYALSRRNDNTYRLDIRLPTALPPGSPPAEIFTLENPSRVVIDLPIAAPVDKEKTILNDSRISSIRFGEHPGKTRIVLDVQGEKPPAHLLPKSAIGGQILTELYFPRNKQIATPQIVTPDAITTSRKTTGRIKSATLRRQPLPANAAQARGSLKTSQESMFPLRSGVPKVVISPRSSKAPQAVYRKQHGAGFQSTMMPGGVLIRLPAKGRQAAKSAASLESIRYRKADDGSLQAIRIHLKNKIRDGSQRFIDGEYLCYPAEGNQLPHCS